MTEAWMSKRVGITECRDKPNDMSVVGAAFTLVAEVTEGNRNKFCVFCQRLRQLIADKLFGYVLADEVAVDESCVKDVRNGEHVFGQPDESYRRYNTCICLFIMLNLSISCDTKSIDQSKKHKPGNLLWSYASERVISASPAIGIDGTVFFGSHDGVLYALNGSNGDLKWKSDVGGKIWASPVVGEDGVVYVSSGVSLNGNVKCKIYALDRETGVKLWEFSSGEQLTYYPSVGGGNMVYVGSWDWKVYCLDGKNGRKIWEYQTEGKIVKPPRVGPSNIVYVGSTDKVVYALSGTTGRKIWGCRTEIGRAHV